MQKNTILSSYEDKHRQMFIIKKSPNETVEIIYRTLFPTRSSKFTTIELEGSVLSTIVDPYHAKPYNVTIGNNILIVTDKYLQIIVDNGSYINIEIPLNNKIIDFFNTALEKNIILNNEYNRLCCNHKDNEGSPILDINGDIVKCTECESVFEIINEENFDQVKESVDNLVSALNTIKLIDNTLTRKELLYIGELSENIQSIPNNLKESFEKLGTF